MKMKQPIQLSLLTVAMLLALPGCGNGDKPLTRPTAGSHVPSPDWQDQVVYFLMIDRFNDGNTANDDQGAKEFDPTSEKKFSGGDLAGVQQKLDYIQQLGATTVWIGSGDLWPTAYSYSMCVLEESQWIRTKSVSSPEFFHGTLELLEDDVCTTLLLTEGPTRAQDERVKEFAARHTKKLTCFDTKEYALPGISDEFRQLLSPVVMAAVLQRISKNIEVITDHSLDIRRYYRKESY